MSIVSDNMVKCTSQESWRVPELHLHLPTWGMWMRLCGMGVVPSRMHARIIAQKGETTVRCVQAKS